MLLVLLLAACASGEEPGSAGGAARDPEPEANAVSDQSIDAALERHSQRLLAHAGIQGIYVGETDAGDPCLVILATVPAEELSTVVGDSLDGWPVRIESGDEIRPVH